MNGRRYTMGIIIVATGRYIRLVGPLLQSIKEFFFANHKVKVFLFTNHPFTQAGIKTINIRDKSWPFITLERHAYFVEHQHLFSGMDFLFSCDADMRFVASVDEEILPDDHEKPLIGVEHPGFCLMSRPTSKIDRLLKQYHLPHRNTLKRLRGTFETNPCSTAYVAREEGDLYFSGAFHGGQRCDFLEMAEKISGNIKKDLSQGHIAIWYDESHLNRYFIDHPPKVLTPSYCYPERWNLPFPKKLLALLKNHEEIRTKEL